MATTKARSLGNTEQNWCRALASGTGTTVLALQITKTISSQIPLLQKTLQKLQKNHPILAFKIQYNSNTKEYFFLKPLTNTPPQIHIKSYDEISNLIKQNPEIPPTQLVMECELNADNWSNPTSFTCSCFDVIYVTMYTLPENEPSVLVLRLHTAVCDRTTAVTFLRELLEVVNGTGKEIENDEEGSFGIEGLVPSRMAKKTLWQRGMNLLGYSLSSFLLTNMKFQSTKWPRRSEVVRMQMDVPQTTRLLSWCKSKDIKLCGALAAAALIAVHSTTNNQLKYSDQLKKKYGVITLTDCRSQFEPPISSQHFGFYHSAILNIHSVKGNDDKTGLSDLAERCYMDFAHYKKCNKHFTDMADLNFLMCKAIENPTLTPSSSLRTSLVTVFDEPVFDNSTQIQQKIGVQGYIGCASAHGVGPSIALFDTIRDGALDCACVYPSPLHSREQITALVDRMKTILINGVCD